MSRVEHFRDGSQQLDMLTENFKERVNNVSHVPLTHADLASDKDNNLIYLGMGRDPDDPESHEFHSYRQVDTQKDRVGFATRGRMYTMQFEPGPFPPPPEKAPHEVSMIWVNDSDQRKGVATAMYKFSRQFLDVRHSEDRTNDGADWTHAIGGPDTAGVDASTYWHPGMPDDKDKSEWP